MINKSWQGHGASRTRLVRHGDAPARYLPSTRAFYPSAILTFWQRGLCGRVENDAARFHRRDRRQPRAALHARLRSPLDLESGRFANYSAESERHIHFADGAAISRAVARACVAPVSTEVISPIIGMYYNVMADVIPSTKREKKKLDFVWISRSIHKQQGEQRMLFHNDRCWR